MKYRYIFLWFFLAFLFQSNFVLNFGIRGLAPNFILCLTIIFAFYHENEAVLIFAPAFGLLHDMSLAALSGPSALTLILVILAINPLKNFFYKESILNVLMISLIGTLLYYGISWSIIKMFRGTYTFAYMLKSLPLLLLMNSLLILLLYFVLAKRLMILNRKKFI